jgi:O-antigen ligase
VTTNQLARRVGERALPVAQVAAGTLGSILCAVVLGAGVAVVIARGQWYLAVGLLLAAPAAVVLHRSPLLAVKLWLVFAPLVTITASGATRRVFWLVHRGLPVATLLLVLLGSLIGLRERPLARLGLPEVMMGGYVIATLVSIAYTSSDPLASFYNLYDTVVVPMSLYLLVRLLEPDAEEVKGLVPAVAFFLISQSVIGLLAWVAPNALPAEWLGKVGERTVGSLRATAVFTTAVVFCGIFLLHVGISSRHAVGKQVMSILFFVLAAVMVFMTFSRASWIAGFVVIVAVLLVYRRFLAQLTLVVVPIVALVLGSGLLTSQLAFAEQRLHSSQSEESALSRLPVAYAALRMFEARPTLGWGYDNFDRYDLGFQRPVGNLVYPEKDHASHNLFLTTLAEQGFIGLVLFVGPTVCWLVRTHARRRALPPRGFLGREFVAALWLVVAAWVIVNNFERMQVPVGFGIWWLTLGLIGTVVDRYGAAPEHAAVTAARRVTRSR